MAYLVSFALGATTPKAFLQRWLAQRKRQVGIGQKYCQNYFLSPGSPAFLWILLFFAGAVAEENVKGEL